MAQIVLGPKFFQKERDNLYSDWPTALVREYLQNSIDADATRIKISVSKRDGGCSFFFSDNGKGMDRSVLENVFFALGETTKNNENSVGGFGRARILTCFSMDSYVIRTRNLKVLGKGGEYEILEQDEYFNGCAFEVNVPDKSVEDMLSAVVKVLSRSQVEAEVVVNDQRFTNWMHRLKATRDLDCGKVYVNRSKESNSKMVVRVRGLWMFDLHTSVDHQVIIEVDPERSRTILTANRDGMHYRFENNLTQFLADAAVDKRSALRGASRKTTLIKGRGANTLYKNIVPNTGPVAGPIANREATHDFETSSAVAVGAAEVSLAEPGPDVSRLRDAERSASRSLGAVESEVRKGHDLPSIYINEETSNPKVLRVIPNFHPDKWTSAVKKVRGQKQEYRKGSEYLKLLFVWQAAVREAVRALLVVHEVEKVRWMPGWEFSHSDDRPSGFGAMHVSVDGGHAICLSPVDANGRLRYKLSSKRDMMKLISLAKHEVAHIVISRHNEDFTDLHTLIDGEYDPNEAMRMMKVALRSARSLLAPSR